MTTVQVDNDNHEKIGRENAKTSESIRKKYRSLKTGKMEEDVEFERQFNPITVSLKQFVENIVGVESNEVKFEPLNMSYEKKESKHGTKRSNTSLNDSLITSSPNKLKRKKQLSNVTSTSIKDVQPSQILYEKTAPSIEEIYETTPERLVTSVQHILQTSEGQNSLRDHLGPLAQKYVATIMSQDKNVDMDYVYGLNFAMKE